jgi:hypothetical protein
MNSYNIGPGYKLYSVLLAMLFIAATKVGGPASSDGAFLLGYYGAMLPALLLPWVVIRNGPGAREAAMGINAFYALLTAGAAALAGTAFGLVFVLMYVVATIVAYQWKENPKE